MSARSLVLSRSAHAATPGKQHKAFDALVRKLERERARLQDWNDARASLSAMTCLASIRRRRSGMPRLGARRAPRSGSGGAARRGAGLGAIRGRAARRMPPNPRSSCAGLKRQLRDTEAQVASIEFELGQLLSRPAARRISPQHVRQDLQELAQALAGACSEIEDLLARGGAVKSLKACPREQDRARQSFEFAMDDAFAELLAAMVQAAPAKPPRRRR